MSRVNAFIGVFEILLSIVILMLLTCDAHAKMIFTRKVNDSYTFTLDKPMLYKGQSYYNPSIYESPKKSLPLMDEFHWNIDYRPFDYNNYDAVAVYLRVNFGPVKAKVTFQVEGTSHKYTFEETFDGKHLVAGNGTFITRKQYLDLLNNGTMTVRCDVEFQISNKFFRQEVFEVCEHVPTDFDLIVENRHIKTHRNFLSLISPVFDEMILNSTSFEVAELDIANYTYDTVKTAIDISYGRAIKNFTVSTVIKVYHFATEYKLKSIADKLEESLMDNINLENFYEITNFAWKNEKKTLQQACADFFHKNRQQITPTREFAKLDPLYMAGVVRMALKLDP